MVLVHSDEHREAARTHPQAQGQEEGVASRPAASHRGVARIARPEPWLLRVGRMPLPPGGGSPLLDAHLHGRPQEAGRTRPQRAGRRRATAGRAGQYLQERGGRADGHQRPAPHPRAPGSQAARSRRQEEGRSVSETAATGTAGGAGTPPRGEMAALRQIKESAQALLEEGKTEETWEFLLSALEAVLSRNSDLELLVAKLRRVHLNPRSERIDPAQLALLFEALVGQAAHEAETDPEAEAQADAQLDREIEDAEKTASETEKTKKRKNGPGWKTRGVRQEVHKLEVPQAERTCTECGREKKPIGEDVTRRLEFVPAHFVEHVYHLEKYACGYCKEGVATAPAPEQVIERSAATASLLAHVVVSKYVDHAPLHRLHRIYDRSGATIPVSTLSDWVREVATRVAPLVERIGERMLEDAYVVSTDATGLRVLDPNSPDNIE